MKNNSAIGTDSPPSFDIDNKPEVSYTEDFYDNKGGFTTTQIIDDETLAGGYSGTGFKSSEEKEIVESYDTKKINKLRRKIDINLIPACAVLYLLCFLDRGNIGNAKIAGMNDDLKMSANDYSIVLVVFFATYCTVEAPCNILLKIIGPRIFLPLTCVLWGVCILGMGFARNRNDLIVLRVLLGLFEAGLMPGCAYYLSNWYKSTELSLRIALFFSASTIAGSFSGILAFFLEKMDGLGGKAGWAWIFIIEGILTIVVGACCYFFLYASPKQARFMKPEEVVFWEYYLRQDASKIGHEHDDDKLTMDNVRHSILDWRVWYFVLMSFGCTVGIYSFSYFMPTTIRDLGWKSSTAQLMSAPPYICACVCTVVASYLSDKFKTRWYFITGPLALLAIPGFIVCITQDNTNVTYGMLFLCVSAVYCPWPSLISWNANNYPNVMTRGIAMGIQVGFASVGAVISAFIYRPKDSPHYRLGHGVVLGSAVMAVFLSLGLMTYYKICNARKEKYCREHPEVYQEDPRVLAAMDTKNPLFRYQL